MTSRYDDDRGILQSSIGMREWPPWTQAFVAVPGVVAVIDSVVAGAIGGIAAIGLDLSAAAAVGIGAALFAMSLAGFATWGRRQIARGRAELVPLFSTPIDSD